MTRPARWLRALRWYVHELLGDTAYARYVRRHEATHPGAEPLSEREFWRRRWADLEAATVSRCC